jgi:DNA-binding NarL/FixJ family response regulator
MIKTLIADDHTVVREGIRRILEQAEDMCVAGEAANGPELLSQVTKGRWDVLIMDLSMPGPPGLEVLEQVRRVRPDLPVLILSMHPEDQYAVRVLAAGASGYINKSSSPDELIKAIRTVASGRRYISSEVAECLASHVDKSGAGAPHERLSNREYHVLRLIASGKGSNAIADELHLSVKTISTFRRRVLDKLGLRNNADIARYAVQHRLLG